MTARVLTGSKKEIVEKLAKLEGEVHEAIVFVEEPARVFAQPAHEAGKDIFKEMEPYMVDVGNVDYSRAAIYSRKPGE